MQDSGSSRGEGTTETDKDRLIEDLREAVRARDEFVAIAAHELRNPITPILMQVSTLAAAMRDPRRCRPEFLAPRIEALELAVRDFVRRSTTLLDVSRIAAGNLRIEFAKVDLSRVVQDVADRMQPAARLARSPMKASIQENIVGTWDRLALEQVAENLFSNAIKFGAGHPVQIRLHSDGQAAHLTVQDYGIGIPEEDRNRILQRFERAVTRRDHGGFGVGLWLAHQLIVAMGGSVAIESAPGKGSTFTVTLPLGGTEQQRASGQ